MERSPPVQIGLVLKYRGLRLLNDSRTAPCNMLPGKPTLGHATFVRVVVIIATMWSLGGLADQTARISEGGDKHKWHQLDNDLCKGPQ